MKHTLIMTGASRGLGYHAAVALLRDDPDLHLVVTSRGDAGETVASELAARSGNVQVRAIHADLASFASIRTAVGTISGLVRSGALPPVNGFVGNAGLQFSSGARRSEDGVEATFAVNVFANYLFVRLLEPLFVIPSRIVLTTSDTHFGDFSHNMGMPAPAWSSVDQLSQPGADTTAAGRTAYTTSKLGLIYLTHALTRHLPQGIDVLSFNPGLVPGTGLVRDGNAFARGMFRAVLPALRASSKAQSPTKAGEQLASVVAGRVNGPTGSYVNKSSVEPSSDESYDEVREAELWRTAAALSGFAPDSPNHQTA